MNNTFIQSRYVAAILLSGCLLLFSQAGLRAQSATGWTGAGGDGFWNTPGNWTNGVPNTNNPVGGAARILNFGTDGIFAPNSTNNMPGANGVSTHRIFFNNGAPEYTLWLAPGTNGTSINDFSQNIPKIQNDSSSLQTIDMNFRMSGSGITTIANRAAEINPAIGDLVFTANSVVGLVTNTQLRFYSSAGHSVTFYGPITNSVTTNTCALMTSISGGFGATVIFFNSHTFTNTFINNGTVRLGANNVTSAPFTLGDTTPTNSAAAALLMDNGLSNDSTLVVRAGSTNPRTIGNTAVGTGNATFSGLISLGTNLTASANPAGTLKFTGVISESGTGARSLTKTGSGTLELSQADTYTGITTISDGVLALTGSGSIANSATIDVANGATFNISAVSFTLGAAQTLKGNGTVTGAATLNGTVAPGASIGTLTFDAAPTLSGTIVAEIDRDASPNADKLVINSGTLTFGGTLTVTNIGSALQNDDTFDLFDGTLAGSFTTVNLPGAANHWKTNDLNVGGTITFTNASPVAQNFTVGVLQGDSLSFQVIEGIHAPTDANSDSMTVTAVGVASSGTSGFTVSNVTYTANGTLGTNTFTYTVTDAFGASDTKTVTVFVVDPLYYNRLSSPSVIGAGTVTLSYLGIPGYNYALEWATNLTSTIVWVPLTTNMAAGNGSLLFTNTSTRPVNFFRTRYVP